MTPKEGIYIDLQDECMIVNDISWDDNGLNGDSFVICGEDRLNFLSEMQEMVRTEKHTGEELQWPSDFYNAFESIIDDYRSIAPNTAYQTMKYTVVEGTRTWKGVSLEGEINKDYHE